MTSSYSLEFLLSKGLTQYKIVNSLGSTEIYPFTNQSEVITDITSTGATLKANNLRVLKDGNIMQDYKNNKILSAADEVLYQMH